MNDIELHNQIKEMREIAGGDSADDVQIRTAQRCMIIIDELQRRLNAVTETPRLSLMTTGLFNARIVRYGDQYGNGRPGRLHEAVEPIVEFFDKRYPHTTFGQFVSSYNVTTLLDDDNPENGLCLDGGIPSWQLSAEQFNEVKKFLRENAFSS